MHALTLFLLHAMPYALPRACLPLPCRTLSLYAHAIHAIDYHCIQMLQVA
jgi:hypothetical protein